MDLYVSQVKTPLDLLVSTSKRAVLFFLSDERIAHLMPIN